MDGAQSDHCLLEAYATESSESAFTELVLRHGHAVYASALRQTGSPCLAEEVTQIVFILLARKASSLDSKVVVLGWLYRATQFTAKDVMKAERRRLARDTNVYETFTHEATLNEPSTAPAWEGISTRLDGCLSQLSDSDRNAILLRFFESRSLAEVGSALGIAEDAARKRVRRALDKLHVLLTTAGAQVGEEEMEHLLGKHGSLPAPQHVLGLAAGAIALPKGIAAEGVDAALGRFARHLFWQKWKTWIAAGAVASSVGSAALVYQTFVPSEVAVSKSRDDYRAAGFPQAQKVHQFVRQIQGLTGKEDKMALAHAIRYPLYVNGPDGSRVINDSEEFIQSFESLFGGKASKVILKCPDHGLYCDTRGIMIGSGEVWIGPDQPGIPNPEPRIIALNLDR